MLIYFCCGTLEWQNVNIETNNTLDKNHFIKQIKLKMIEKPNKNIPLILIKCIKLVRLLAFEEKPCYSEYIKILESVLIGE